MADFTVRTSAQLPVLLQAFRKESGLTQAAAAKRMGITQQTLSALERNAQKASVDRLLHLLNVLGVELVLREKVTETPPPKDPSAPIW